MVPKPGKSVVTGAVPTPDPAHSKYRADIDGLRAVAVLAVVGFHAFPSWFRGGFFGVDIFFVISGFLISTIIFGGLHKGTFSFSEFYARRVRRIFPSLVLVLAACWVFSWFALYADEFGKFGGHMLAGAAFVSNFNFWMESGYFDAVASTKPMLHLWSLSIEEQFYILWPLILFLTWKYRVNALRILGAISVISVAAFMGLPKLDAFYLPIGANGIEYGQLDLTRVFYSPLARSWELLLGALLSYATLHPLPASARRIWVANGQSALGMMFIVCSVFLFETPKASPGLSALLPTLGAFLLLCAGPAAYLNRRLLSHPVMVWFGLISYPLYLWHWPMLSFLHITESAEVSPILRMGAIGLSVALAWLSYQFVEKPMRSRGYGNMKVALLCLAMIVIGLLGGETLRSQGYPDRSELIRQHSISLGAPPQHTQAGLNCKGRVKIPECAALSAEAVPTIALIGDSHAGQLFIGLEEYYKARGENLVNMLVSMILKDVGYRQDGADFDSSRARDAILDYIVKEKSIKTVILAIRGPLLVSGTGFRLSDRYEGEPKKRELYHNIQKGLQDNPEVFRVGLRSTLAFLRGHGKEIVFVYDNPELGFNPISSCLKRPLSFFSSPRPCVVERRIYEERNAAYHSVVRSVLSEFPAVKTFSPVESLCDERYCHAYRDGLFLYKDDDHFSEAGSRLFGRNFVPSSAMAR